MGGRGHESALVGAHLEDLHHERHVIVLLEPFGDVLAQDARRERPERFAALDLEVEDVLHVGPARVAEDGAVAERARPPFHAALEPADDAPVGDRRGGDAAELALVVAAPPLAAAGAQLVRPRLQQRLDLGRCGLRTDVGVRHGAANAGLQAPRHGQGRADGAAGIAGGGGQVQALEGRLQVDLAVGHGVHGAAAGEGEVRAAVARVQRFQQGKQGLLVHGLGTAGEIAVLLLERLARAALRSEQGFQRVLAVQGAHLGTAVIPAVMDVVGVVAEAAQVKLEAAVRQHAHQFAHLRQVARLAVGRQAHDLVLVAEVREAEELGDDAVEDAKRMREVDATVDADGIAAAEAPGAGGEVAEAVDRQADRLVEIGGEEGGGEVGAVVLDVMDLGAQRLPRKGAGDRLLDRGGAADVGEALEDEGRAGPALQDVEGAAPAVDARVAVDGEVVDVGEAQAGILQAPAHGLGGQAGPVLDAAEALLFSRGDELAVLHQGGGGVAMIGVQSEDNHVRSFGQAAAPGGRKNSPTNRSWKVGMARSGTRGELYHGPPARKA